MSRALWHLDKPSLLSKPISPITYEDRLHQLMRDHFSFSVGSGQNPRKGFLSGWPCSQEGQLKYVPETLGDFRAQSVINTLAELHIVLWVGGASAACKGYWCHCCTLCVLPAPTPAPTMASCLLLLQAPYTLSLLCARRIHNESSSHSCGRKERSTNTTLEFWWQTSFLSRAKEVMVQVGAYLEL